MLTVGTDCAIGKMSVALELRRAATAAGRSASFVPTGQTGMMIEGWGVAIDRVIADFVQGTAEWLAEEGEARGDWVIVEGQGSLDHPAYSSRDARAHPRDDAARDGHGPQAGPGRPRLRPPARRALPDRDAARVHRAPRAGGGARRAVEGRRGRAQHVAHRRRGRGPPDDRGDAAETGLPVDDPVRFGGDGLWREIEAAVEALPWVARPGRRAGRAPMTLALRLRTLELPLRDPFVIARSIARRGPAVTTVVVELRDEADGPTGRSGSARATRTRTTARRPRRWRPSRRCCSRRSSAIEADLRGGLDDVRAALEDAEGLMTAAIGHHGAIKCAIDIALHDLAGKRLGLPVRELLGDDRRAAADRLHAGHRRAGRRGGARAPGGATSRRSRSRSAGPPTSRRSRRCARVFDGPIRVDANTGWTPDEALALLPELERLGVELIEQPFPARRYDQLRWLQERSSLPIVADESAVTIEDLDALVGRRRRASTSSSRSAAAWGPRGGCSSAPASSGSGRSSAAWRRRRS